MIVLIYILVIISITLCLFLFLGKQSNFFNVKKIISNHLLIFKDAKIHLAALCMLPATLSALIMCFQLLNSDILMGLITILSIFTAIFLSMLGIITSLKKTDQVNNKLYNQVLKETFNTVLFESLMTITILLFSMIYLLINKYNVLIISYSVSFIIYYLTIFMFLNSLIGWATLS